MTRFAPVGEKKIASEKRKLDLGLQACLFVFVRRVVYSESTFRPWAHDELRSNC